MPRPKKVETEVSQATTESVILRVMNDDGEIIKIDSAKEPDYATKYRHPTGKPFEIC